jgi:putative oxidoreductase
VTDVLALIGRVALAALFVWAGYHKLMDPAGTQQYLGSHNLPTIIPVPVLYWIVVAIELGGGVLLVLGIPARTVALILAVWSVLTAVLVHLPAGDMPNMINFYKNIGMAGGLLYVLAFGPGALSVGGRRSA